LRGGGRAEGRPGRGAKAREREMLGIALAVKSSRHTSFAPAFHPSTSPLLPSSPSLERTLLRYSGSLDSSFPVARSGEWDFEDPLCRVRAKGEDICREEKRRRRGR